MPWRPRGSGRSMGSETSPALEAAPFTALPFALRSRANRFPCQSMRLPAVVNEQQVNSSTEVLPQQTASYQLQLPQGGKRRWLALVPAAGRLELGGERDQQRLAVGLSEQLAADRQSAGGEA